MGFRGGSGSGGGAGTLVDAALARKVYDPILTATQTTLGSLQDVDAANLVISFTTPDSGKVKVVLEGQVGLSPAQYGFWGLREGSTDIDFRRVGAETNYDLPCRTSFYLTGLTPGSVHTYKWAHASTAGATITTRYGGDAGPAMMEVFPA